MKNDLLRCLSLGNMALCDEDVAVYPKILGKQLFPSFLQGIKAVIAESFERIHRSNLVGMGIVPLQYLPDQNAESLGLNGKEMYSIDLPTDLKPGQNITVKVLAQFL